MVCVAYARWPGERGCDAEYGGVMRRWRGSVDAGWFAARTVVWCSARNCPTLRLLQKHPTSSMAGGGCAAEWSMKRSGGVDGKGGCTPTFGPPLTLSAHAVLRQRSEAGRSDTKAPSTAVRCKPSRCEASARGTPLYSATHPNRSSRHPMRRSPTRHPARGRSRPSAP